jgi:hypothetical protein
MPVMINPGPCGIRAEQGGRYTGFVKIRRRSPSALLPARWPGSSGGGALSAVAGPLASNYTAKR